MPIPQRGEGGDDRTEGFEAPAADERGHVGSPSWAADTARGHRGAVSVACVLMVLTTVAYPQKCMPSATIQLLGKPNQATPGVICHPGVRDIL